MSMPENNDSNDELRRFQKDVFPRVPPGAISGDGSDDEGDGGEPEPDATVETRYVCPVDGTPDDDGMPPKELSEHLVAEHTLRERIDALVRSADPAN